MASHNTASYSLKESESVEAAKFTSMKRLFARPLLPIFVTLLVIFAILAIINDQKQWVAYALAMALVSPVALFIVVWWVIPMQARRHFQQAVALADEIIATWDDNGIGYASAHGSSRFSWEDYHGWAETAHLLILYQSENYYNLLPKRAFNSAEFDAIKRRLGEANVSEV